MEDLAYNPTSQSENHVGVLPNTPKFRDFQLWVFVACMETELVDIPQTDPRILVVDSYDSFTNNLVSLIINAIPASHVFVIRNDQFTVTQLLPHLSLFSAVVAGPGPGSPLIDADVGVVKHLWHLSDEHLLPIFGVCLGLQSLGVEYGAKLQRLCVVKHGQLSSIRYNSDPLFKSIHQAEVVRYHSLHVVLDEGLTSPDLQALAWADDEPSDGPIVMALKHRSRPFWAVQYHPESALTDSSGIELVKNFWDLAEQWHSTTGRLLKPWNTEASVMFGQPWPSLPLTPSRTFSEPQLTVKTVTVDESRLSAVDICEWLRCHHSPSEFSLLESASQPGRFSIIGVILPSSSRISYHCDRNVIYIQSSDRKIQVELGHSNVWTWLSRFMQRKQAHGGYPDVPFWGGLIGYLNYELGVESLGCRRTANNAKSRNSIPDASFVFIERSIVLDSHTGRLYVQSIIPGDDWCSMISAGLNRACSESAHRPISEAQSPYSSSKPIIIPPSKDSYVEKVQLAKEYLFAGESYELCVTARTRVCVPVSPEGLRLNSWDLYKILRDRNPAPYAAFLQLHPVTLISSSPERFLSFTRPPYQRCELRPIKGTVRKAKGVTHSMAANILGNTKETAENLMIVDLIRHDLHGVVGNHVRLSKFCGIEEYETLWQSVSVIEGGLDPNDERSSHSQVGWETLKKSLPPGSMTGAPKKRSVEILQKLEDDDRGLYSGVMGYWCVGGSGDWSVVIRSCFQYDSATDHPTDNKQNHMDEWIIGSGGAITALSDPEAEWDEMVVKLQSVLRAFDPEYEVHSGNSVNKTS